jgi:hypothetical protein
VKLDDELAKLLGGGVNPDFGGVYADGLLAATGDELADGPDDFGVNAFDPNVYPDGLVRGEVGESKLADFVVFPL